MFLTPMTAKPGIMKLFSSYDSTFVDISLSKKIQDVNIVIYSFQDSVTETMSCKGLLLLNYG
jgi:uncharacterized protein Veg